MSSQPEHPPQVQLLRSAGEPQVEGLDPHLARRVRITVSCRDTDALEKVPGAGDILGVAGERVQLMHNGLLIAEGCYYGPWMTEIIRGLRGHHEPQEEVVFAEVLRRLKSDTADAPPVVVEFGSFWAYYSMWFLQEFPAGRAICIEPDAAYLKVGQDNFARNGLVGEFHRGAVGAAPGELLSFRQESDGAAAEVLQYDLDSVLAMAGLAKLDLLMVDIQGAETVLLERAVSALTQGQVRYLIISTHHHLISGSALTHQRSLEALVACGAEVLCEHSVSESFSGDGLIAVGFPQAGADCRPFPISFARARDSLFGELEYDLDVARSELAGARAGAAAIQAQLRGTQDSLAVAQAEIANLARRAERAEAELKEQRVQAQVQSDQLAAILASRSWRLSRPLRAAGKSLRRGGRQG